jgi:uncharacterized protein
VKFLLDVNTVLALLDPQHVFHELAHTWAEVLPDATWMTCPIVQNGVIRVASQPAYPNSLGTASAVREVLEDFCASPRHEFCPDDISLVDDGRLVRPELFSPSRVTDLYLLALAKHHSARLATFDRKIPADAIVGGADTLSLISVERVHER